MKYWLLAAVFVGTLTNVCWYRHNSAVTHAAWQALGLLDECESYMKGGSHVQHESLELTQYAEKPRYVAKATHLGPMAVGVTCLNGADPTVAGNYGNVLIVSCGK